MYIILIHQDIKLKIMICLLLMQKKHKLSNILAKL